MTDPDDPDLDRRGKVLSVERSLSYKQKSCIPYDSTNNGPIQIYSWVVVCQAEAVSTRLEHRSVYRSSYTRKLPDIVHQVIKLFFIY